MYTGIQFANNASTQLAQACTASDTTLTVGENATAAFPKINSVSDYFMLTLADTNGHYEIVKCTAKTETTFTVVRAQEGTTARPYPIGALLENRLTAAGIVHIAEDASTTKPHVSETGEYGKAAALVYGHAKISDNFESGDQALAGTLLSPFGFQQAVARLQGLKETKLFTTSTTWIVPETGTYKITCVGGGGKGGNGSWGGWGHPPDCGIGGYFYSGGGGGGGGAGQVITVEKQLTKGATINLVIGGVGGSTVAGSYATALAGTAGNSATDATCVRGSCTGDSCDSWSIGNAGYGGSAGYSYGTAAVAGANGGASNTAYATVYGGTGGQGGVSAEGTYGMGGKGGNGGNTSDTPSGFVYGAPGTGLAGTQGCVKIQSVLGS